MNNELDTSIPHINLTMIDMNSLNAISGFLEHLGYSIMADILYRIQCEVTKIIVFQENNQ